MFQGKLSLSIFMLFLVACGGKYEAPHDVAVADVGLQTTKPVQGLSRIDCELELKTTDGKIVRLSDSSAVFEMNESAGSDWASTSVVIPMKSYSLLARYSLTALKAENPGPSFYMVLCKSLLAVDGTCSTDDSIEVSERTGTVVSSVNNNLKADIQFQFEQHSIRQLNASCTLKLEPIP